MILFKSSAGKGCIELHTDGDSYWFMERWGLRGNQMIKSDQSWHSPYEIVRVPTLNKWLNWHSRPWLAPMLGFMQDYFGEDLFTLVALENL